MSDQSGQGGGGQGQAYDLREYFEDQEEMLRTAFEGMMRECYFSFPVSVVEDSDGKSVKLQINVKGRFTDTVKGGQKWVDMPTLDKVPIHFVSGGANKEGKGGWTVTHPITKGDEGMVVFSSRSIDNWLEKGGTQQPVDNRYHHLSDAKYIPGMRSKPRQLKNISTKTVQFRSDDEGDDKKPKHVFDMDHKKGVFVHSVDSGRHVATIDTDKGMTLSVEKGKHTVVIDKSEGISHKSEVKVHIEAKKLTSKGSWDHDGGLKATKTIQSAMGLKAPLIAGAPGNPPDAD